MYMNFKTESFINNINSNSNSNSNSNKQYKQKDIASFLQSL